MIVVSSLNNYITNGDDTHVEHWASFEDHLNYLDIYSHAEVIIMGKSTFLAMHLKVKKPQIVFVLTSNPEELNQNYSQPNLFFINKSAQEIVKDLSSKNYNQILVIGGSSIFNQFLEAKLINKIYLTIEPILFTSGVRIFDQIKEEINLKLIDIKKLNSKGTLFLEYQII